MSNNDTDSESVHKDEIAVDDPQEDSGSEYQSEDDHSDDDARSVQSARSEKSNRSTRSGSGRNSTSKDKVPPRITKSTKATYSDAYRDFYNKQIEELVRPFYSVTHALPASEIGAAVWTPLEKEILFQKVSALGKDNIKEISNAIRTKSESEVRQYLSLLDQGTIEGNVTKALPVFSAADVSPAFEVTKQSEELLEEYADGLAVYQTRSDQKREKKRHGDYWLLTEEIAQEVEKQVMARDESYLKSKLHDEEDEGEEEDGGPDGAKSNQEAANTDVETDQEKPGTDVEDESDAPRKATSESQEPDLEPSESSEEIMVPAAELLDLPMWLRLSRLFMYRSPELGDSWNDFTSGHQTPSMYHTAFQDFHNLTISLTRRVVQATIFQTMTRLRARDKDHPSAAVTANDVRAASDILDLRPNTRKFWGSVPRRHGLRVYERGSKSSRGQSRAGLELDLEEAEERLGVGHASKVPTVVDENTVQADEDEMEGDVLDPDQYYEDSELWTEASDAEEEIPVNIPEDPQSDASGDEDAAYHPADDEEAQDATRKKQQRKGRMEKNFQKAHDAYLEAVDQEISRVQEIDMWDALGVAPPNDIKDEEVEIPRQPVIKRRLSDIANWRTDFEYQPPWELGFDTLRPEAFASIQKRGEQAKKRRRMAYNYLEQKGLVVLPQQAPEPVIVRRKPRSLDVDTDMDDAPTEPAAIATTETFDDGVPRKKLPTPLVNKALSRASSVRESSHDSTTSHRSAHSTALMNSLVKRQPVQEIEEDARKAEKREQAEEQAREQAKEEKRKAEEQAEEEKRKARAARKTLSEEERLALKKEQQDEKHRKALEKRRKEQKEAERLEQLADKEQQRLAKDEKKTATQEKQRLAEEKRMAKEEQQRLAKEEKQMAKEEKKRVKAEKRKAMDEQTVQDEPGAEQPEDTIRSTRSRSKKPKRKSGF
ncbi:hypothetical protein E4T51_07106 [Aureobasidium sp. EXF-12344]|nr:hypothetical protein E4T51_07106 [Aureobasidium sp. EXF-12344]